MTGLTDTLLKVLLVIWNGMMTAEQVFSKTTIS